MTLYADLTEQQAAAALEEFLEERPAALRHLVLAVGDAVELDHSVRSLEPLWVWVKERLRLGPPGQQPSWSRLGLGGHERLDAGSLQLLDGLISYVVDIVAIAVPEATWEVATDPHPKFLHKNQPMLRAGAWEQVPARTIGNLGRQVFSDWPPADDRLASIVDFWLFCLAEVANT
ncbi:hypothetical protein [Nocardioides marmoribigeumensis]|jgi:hypothetical protein|uniref:Uncharacterized protein n=1 Tax=Nocardioides marmoribigeumensis TaxID=433649 RepID=A0ABU2BYS5_9ACTN|nr:hypothetical protein [Nocardioides marmoribigeumensis]MDR7363555.1 hypothetical protein [Nocardioides marmoribigeumensis]